jgi:hypothetical protein
MRARRKRVCIECRHWVDGFFTNNPAWARCYEIARTLDLTDPIGGPVYLATPPGFGCILFARKIRLKLTSLPLKPKEE